MGPLHLTLTRHLQVTLPHRDQHVVGREYVPRFGEPVLYVKMCLCLLWGLLPLSVKPHCWEIFKDFLPPCNVRVAVKVEWITVNWSSRKLL